MTKQEISSMFYNEIRETESAMTADRKLIKIKELEDQLFFTIDVFKNATDLSQRGYLGRRIDELQGLYSRAHI